MDEDEEEDAFNGVAGLLDDCDEIPDKLDLSDVAALLLLLPPLLLDWPLLWGLELLLLLELVLLCLWEPLL